MNRSNRSNQRRKRCGEAQAAMTLVEVLAAMTVLSVLLLMLVQALDLALDQWSRGSEISGARGEVDAALEFLERDLRAAVTSRSANLARLPASVSDEQRQFFSGRLVLPFEVNRRQGEVQEHSFVNAAEEFDSLAFVRRASVKAQGDSRHDQARLGIVGGSSAAPDEVSSRSGTADACLGGYYVAWTRNSPLKSGSEFSMKLFRHFRPGGPAMGQGRSRGFVRALGHLLNEAEEGVSPTAPAALLRRGVFNNASLPFLFSQRLEVSPDGAKELVDADQPWPMDAAALDLSAPPTSFQRPDSDWSAWSDPQNAVHDYLTPDEPLAYNVVRFECRPYRWATDSDGKPALVNAAQLNELLGLSGDDENEWPVLVAPDFVDVTIGVISRVTASQLQNREDWIVDWSMDSLSQWSAQRRIMERSLQVHTARLFLSGGS